MADIFTTIRNEIGKGFKGKLSKGHLLRRTAEVIDLHGDQQSSGDELYSFEGFIDGFSAYFRATAGIPVEDVQVVIIATSMATEPTADDRVQMTTGPHKDKWFQLRGADSDPAKATWTCRAFPIADPYDG